MASLISVRKILFICVRFLKSTQIPPLTPSDPRVKLLVPLVTVPQNSHSGQNPQRPEATSVGKVGEEPVNGAATATLAKSPAKGWIPVRGSAPASDNPHPRLDLS